MDELKVLLDLAQKYWVFTLVFGIGLLMKFNRPKRAAKETNHPLKAPSPTLPSSHDKFRRTLGSHNTSQFRTTDPADESVLDAIRANNKIEAIKLVREAKGIGLKEAKEYVEALERNMKE